MSSEDRKNIHDELDDLLDDEPVGNKHGGFRD